MAICEACWKEATEIAANQQKSTTDVYAELIANRPLCPHDVPAPPTRTEEPEKREPLTDAEILATLPISIAHDAPFVKSMLYLRLRYQEMQEHERLMKSDMRYWPESLLARLKHVSGHLGICGDLVSGVVADWLSGRNTDTMLEWNVRLTAERDRLREQIETLRQMKERGCGCTHAPCAHAEVFAIFFPRSASNHDERDDDR